MSNLISNSNQSNQRQRAGAISCPFLYTRQPLNTITMNNTAFTPYQRNELKGMTNAQLVSLIRTAAENFPDTSLILTPRIDQSGQAYYWTGLRYGGTIELDFALLLNREIEGFVLSFLIGGSQGLVDIGSSNPDPDMTRGIDWLQCHQYRHIEYAQTVRDFIRTSNGRTFQNRKLTFPHGSIVYSQEIKDVFSTEPR